MSIPNYQNLMLPILRLAFTKNKILSTKETAIIIAKEFNLSICDLNTTVSSSKQKLFNNRINWALTYLKKAELIESTSWGKYRITARGKSLIKTDPTDVNLKFLKNYKEFNDFQNKKGTRKNTNL